MSCLEQLPSLHPPEQQFIRTKKLLTKPLATSVVPALQPVVGQLRLHLCVAIALSKCCVAVGEIQYLKDTFEPHGLSGLSVYGCLSRS